MERQVKERLVGAVVLVAAAVILIPELLSGPKGPPAAPAPARAGEAPMKTYTIDLNHSPDAPAAAAVEDQAPPQEASPAENPSAPDAQRAADTATSGAAANTAAVAAEPQASVAAEPGLSKPATPPAQSAAEQATAARFEPPAAASRPETKPESAAVKSSTPVRPPVTPTPAIAAADKKPPPQAAQPTSPKPVASVVEAPISKPPIAKPPIAKQWAVQLGSFASKANAERLVQEWEGRGQRGSVSPVQAASGTLYRARLGPFADRQEAEETLRKVRASVNGAAIVALP